MPPSPNRIYLRRRRRLVVPQGMGRQSDGVLAALLEELRLRGHVLTREALESIRKVDDQTLKGLYDDLVEGLNELLGGTPPRPMYVNFPQDVHDTPRFMLRLKALIHYVTGWLPGDAAWKRGPGEKVDTLTPITLGDDADFLGLFRALLGGKGSLSETDQKDLRWLVEHRRDSLAAVIPAKFHARETLAFFASLLADDPAQLRMLVRDHFKTATDVLRLAVALSGGDVSLAEAKPLRSFPRKQRRLMLELLEACGPSRTEDMLRRPEMFKRLGERLHPGEFRQKFPETASSFDVVRKDLPHVTFATRAEHAVAKRDAAAATRILAERPGELARRLDHLLRLDAHAANGVLEAFAEGAERISTPVLLQALAHFKRRGVMPAPSLRVFFPKGQVAKAWAQANTLPPLDAKLVARTVRVLEDALIARFATKPPLGKVFVDPALADFVVPLAQRSASKALRTVARGSRFPLPDGGTIRFFLWWKEGLAAGKPTGRVDIDLSAVAYGPDWRYVDHVSYTNLKASRFKAAHSGDITAAPNGASEYIDLDVESFVKNGARFVVMSVNSFSQQPFKELPECYAGWMTRKEPNSGEIYDPRTVAQRADLAGDTKIAIPAVLDLVEKKVMWCDLALARAPRWQNNVEGNFAGMTLLGRAMSELNKPDLATLFKLHAQARGTLVTSRAAADVVFALDGAVTPYHAETILSEWL